MVWLLALREHANSDSSLLKRELPIYRSQRQCNPAKLGPNTHHKNEPTSSNSCDFEVGNARKLQIFIVVQPSTNRYR